MRLIYFNRENNYDESEKIVLETFAAEAGIESPPIPEKKKVKFGSLLSSLIVRLLLYNSRHVSLCIKQNENLDLYKNLYS